MKKLLYPTVLLFILSALLVNLTGCGGPYADAKSAIGDMIFITEEYINDIDSVKTAGDYAKAIEKYASAMEKLIPKMKELEKKYPNLKGKDTPEELKPTMEKLEAVMKKMMTASMKMMKFGQDPAVQKATEKLQAAMMGGSERAAQDKYEDKSETAPTDTEPISDTVPEDGDAAIPSEPAPEGENTDMTTGSQDEPQGDTQGDTQTDTPPETTGTPEQTGSPTTVETTEFPGTDSKPGQEVSAAGSAPETTTPPAVVSSAPEPPITTPQQASKPPQKPSKKTPPPAASSPNAPPPPVVNKAPTPPPAKTMAVVFGGSSQKLEALEFYVESILPGFFKNRLDIIENQRNAGYHLVIEARDMATKTLSHFGSTSTQYTIHIAMKIIDSKTGKLKTSASQAVEFTNLNEEENIKEAIRHLLGKLEKRLK